MKTTTDLGLNIKNSGYQNGQTLIIAEPICIAGVHFNLNEFGVGSMRILTEKDMGELDFGSTQKYLILDIISKYAKVDEITFQKIRDGELVQILFAGQNKPQIWLAGIEIAGRLGGPEKREVTDEEYYPIILDSIDYSNILIIDV